ncbi:MAG: MotA/TolQ/ExbB proton channel family protein [Leptospiraceae bacterium]|nr:MotA/TolQ/ExbB proton channel family protein [Leptospiraceae bacterium]MCP5502437.1 MotA/TolQ/ExbB proton channel family protein [Leptospiraceae bacterium]
MEQLVDRGEITIFWIMGFASVIAFAVFLERYIVFWRNTRGSKILAEIISSIRAGEHSHITEKASKRPSNIYNRFAKFGIEFFHTGHESLSELMSGKMIEEKIYLEKRLPILATLGNNAPFIGLLGTVLGVIKAFASLGTLGNSGAEVVMKSISTALFATAAGLLIAIPVVMVNNYFTKKVKVIGQNLEIISREFLASQHNKTKVKENS